jgi:twitching motility protein PilT
MMQMGKPFGWSTFDDCIIKFFEDGLITKEVAEAYASKRAVVKRGIDAIRSSRGEKTTDIEGLQIDRGYTGKVG